MSDEEVKIDGQEGQATGKVQNEEGNGQARPAGDGEGESARIRFKGGALLLYGLLAVSAVMSFLGMTTTVLPEQASIVGPILFAVFYVCFVCYRLLNIRSRRYPARKGVVQIACGAVFLMLLFAVKSPVADQDRGEIRGVKAMLSHSDPSVRALACDAFSSLDEAAASDALPELRKLLNDGNSQVREHAARALERRAGGSGATGN